VSAGGRRELSPFAFPRSRCIQINAYARERIIKKRFQAEARSRSKRLGIRDPDESLEQEIPADVLMIRAIEISQIRRSFRWRGEGQGSVDSARRC